MVEFAQHKFLAGQMTLTQSLGQLVLPELRPGEHLKSPEKMDAVRALIRQHGVGGFCLCGGDQFETPELLNALQQLSAVPLLVAADLEDGAGCQVRGGTVFPSNLAVGAARSEDLAHLKGRVTAVEARALGIHMTFAPVVDVQSAPDNPIVNTRGFGEDPTLVARLAAAFHHGCRERGLLTCAKHFPGLGNAPADAPLVVPAARATRERLQAVDLVPFSEMIRAGTDAIMTAHLLVEALDRRLPASLSPAVVADLLRRDMGFQGMIVTDALVMGGIAADYAEDETLVLAASAGNDALLCPAKPERAPAALEAAVKAGRLQEKPLRASAQRLLDLKGRLGLLADARVRPEQVERMVGTRDHLAAAQRIADASITLVKDAPGLLPLVPRRFGPFFEVRIVDETAGGNLELFGEELRRRFGMLTTFRVVPGQDTSPILGRLRDAARGRPKAALIVGVFSRPRPVKAAMRLDGGIAAFVQAAVKALPNSVVASFGSPYVIRQFPEAPAYVCGYSDCEATQRAMARVLCGELAPQGKLPVTLGSDFKVGHGLTPK